MIIFRLTYLLLLFLIPNVFYAQQSVEIDLNTEYQEIRGFGGMNHTVWIDDLNEDQREKAFGNDPGELGLSILRMHIDPNESAWDMEVSTATHAKNKGALIFASPWNPPAELLDAASDYNRIPSSNYDEYVDHLNSFNTFMNNNSISLHAISVQNEPDYGEEGGWTDWTSDEMVTFLKQHAQNINSQVMAPESFQFIRSYSDPILNDPTASANLDIMAGHIYGGGLFDYPLARDKGKEVWMTEHYTSSNNSANLWPNALGVGVEIHDCMEANFNAYVWWYIRRFYGLITDDGNISKRGYVFSHFSKFVRPGFTRIDVSNDSDVMISAYKSGSSTVVIVVVNNTNNEAGLDFDVMNGSIDELTMVTTSEEKNMENEGVIALTGGSFSATIPARSITTFTSNPLNIGKFSNVYPIAMAGEDITITDEDNNGTETVMLNGSGSSDSDGTIVNYSWSLDDSQISFMESESINLPTGSHEIILTVTDNDGARDMDTLTVTVNLPETANEEFIWLDAECGEVGSNWMIEDDPLASNGKYTTVTPGVQSLDAASESPEDLITLTFDVVEPGVYRVWGHVQVPSPDDDSFWIKMDDGDWILWNSITGGSSWEWDDVHDSNDGGSIVTYQLNEGSHTLSICFREDGADLDKFLLTNTGNVPSGLGEASAIECLEEPEVTGLEDISEPVLKVYPNPTSSEISISWDSPFDRVAIYNMNGREIYHEEFTVTMSSITLPLNLKSGVYFLLLKGDAGIERSKLIVE